MKGQMILFLSLVGLVAGTFTINGKSSGQRYDGHGALSAGASSRLLYDYPEPQRSDILDLLFKPNFGASLHQIKVEIGGDVQSTDGTEPSHMHERDDLSCARGYEFWLLREARKRNPKIVTNVLSWGVPFWVGYNESTGVSEGYYCQDNIDYHIKWLECVDQLGDIGSIDYIGNWNERSWGPANWTVDFRAAMDAAGHSETKLILADGQYPKDIIPLTQTEPDFASAMEGGGIGLHYPCDQPPRPEVQAAHLKYWSSEDSSTVGDWAGAGCWGRLLNQNWVRMNMTATVMWSLIWSVYEGNPYYGNGLMYAYEPWSGHYDIAGGAIWTSAHTTQFVEVGWTMLDVNGGSGPLPGGGSYLTMVSPDRKAFSLVVEKLHGKCLRCAGQTTTAEEVHFQLAGGLESVATKLCLWSTNETSQFIRLPDLSVSKGAFSFSAEPDTIYTVSTIMEGPSKGAPLNPPPAPFPLPYNDDFDSYVNDAEAKYFADDGGSWTVAPDPTEGGKRNKVLKQWVRQFSGKNGWCTETEPVTQIGPPSLNSSKLSARVFIPQASPPSSKMYAGICSHLVSDGRGKHAESRQGLCLNVFANGAFVLQNNGALLASGPLPMGAAGVGQWLALGLDTSGLNTLATINGHQVASIPQLSFGPAPAALNSGHGIALFDDFEMA